MLDSATRCGTESRKQGVAQGTGSKVWRREQVPPGCAAAAAARNSHPDCAHLEGGGFRVFRIRVFRIRVFRIRVFRIRVFRIRGFRIRGFRVRGFRVSKPQTQQAPPGLQSPRGI